MQFTITKQIAVEAETPEEAVAKINDGNTIALSVQQRPQQQAQPTNFGSRGQGSIIPQNVKFSPTPTTTTTKQVNG